MKTILLIGIEPESIDFSGTDTPPGMTAEKLSAEIAATQRQFDGRGDRVDVCPVTLDASAAAGQRPTRALDV